MAAPPIRLRILDLLGTIRDEWLSVERLIVEYESRWGEVNRQSLRRTITRLISGDPALVEARYVDGPFSVNHNLELRMTSEIYWDLDWDELENSRGSRVA